MVNRLGSPEEIAFGSVDDDAATAIARAMGWGGESDYQAQDYVRLPEFGPRKIHSTREVEPDPLLGNPFVPNDGVVFQVNINGGPWMNLPSPTISLYPGQAIQFGVVFTPTVYADTVLLTSLPDR